MTLGSFFEDYVDAIAPDMPQSYRHIQLNFTNTSLTDNQRETLQKIVYLDLFPNIPISFPYNTPINERIGSLLIERNYPTLSVAYENMMLTQDVVDIWLSQLPLYYQRFGVETSPRSVSYPLLHDIQAELEESFLYRDRLDMQTMEYGAAQWLIESLDDTYTTFMPPAQTTLFYEGINEVEFSGIGAYIELTNAWQLMIVAPIKNSPAQRAGIQAGDIIVQIDDYKISGNENITELVDRIKGPSWTKVSLSVLRDSQTLVIDVIRDTIIVPMVETELLDNNVFYLRINSFGDGVANKVINELQRMQDIGAQKLIIDVTNNPGGLLSETLKILEYFVPEGEVIATSRYINDEEQFIADETSFSLLQTPIVILVNEWSASASEILAWAISRYNTNTILLGKQTFGKGSVQSLIDYSDGSALKMTIAKWYIADSTNSIEWVGIPADIISDNEWQDLIDEALSLISNM